METKEYSVSLGEITVSYKTVTKYKKLMEEQAMLHLAKLYLEEHAPALLASYWMELNSRSKIVPKKR